MRDENGNTLEYDYDAMERLNLLKGAAGGNINKNELIYSGSNISEIKHPGTQYNIAYDSKKHISAFRIGSDNFFTTENFIYGAHGEFLTYNYPESNVTLYADKYGRTVKEVWSDGGQRCYCYGAESENMSGVTAGNFENRSTYSAAKLRKVIDGTDYVVYNYVDGDFVGKEYGDGKSYTVRYDAYGRVNSEEVKYSTSGYQNTFYLYNDGDAANGDRVGLAFLSDGTNTSVASFIYDECGRLKNQIKGTLHGSTLNEVENVQYRYGLADPTVVSQVVYGNGETCNYVYDSCGNITQITGKENVKYTYDALNRLVREDNADIGNSYEYNYDAGGNITAKKVYGYTTGMLGAPIKTYSYVYGDDNWKDKLTSWNGQSITYDDIGKPLDYKGCTLAWDERNRLIRTLNSKAYTEYTYGKDGKPVKSVSLISGGYIGTSEITYAEGRLYKKTTRVTTVSGSLLSESETEFLYCGEEVIGLKYNGGMYYYRKNLQGDIIAIVDEEGNEVGRYAYDAWGNCLASGSGVISANPFRYRGYYWDGEAGLYFLNTRWYDPETGRFISPDSINYLDPESINGLNLYAYCLNNPIMYTDPNGTTAWWEWLIGAVVVVGLVAGAVLTGGIVAAAFAGAAIGGAISYGTQAVSGELNWGQFALDIGVGAITGAIGASGLSKTAVTVLGGAIGSGSSIVSDLINGKPVDWGKAAISGLIGIAAGYAGGAGIKNVQGLAESGKFFGASSNLPGITAFLLILEYLQRRILNCVLQCCGWYGIIKLLCNLIPRYVRVQKCTCFKHIFLSFLFKTLVWRQIICRRAL